MRGVQSISRPRQAPGMVPRYGLHSLTLLESFNTTTGWTLTDAGDSAVAVATDPDGAVTPSTNWTDAGGANPGSATIPGKSNYSAFWANYELPNVNSKGGDSDNTAIRFTPRTGANSRFRKALATSFTAPSHKRWNVIAMTKQRIRASTSVTLGVRLATESGFTNFYNWSITPGKPNWFGLRLGSTGYTETGTVSGPLTHIQVAFTPPASTQQDVVVDSLHFTEDGQPFIMATFDDGAVTQYSVAYQTMRQYGMRGTCFLIVDQVGSGGKLSLAQIKEMYSDGWDFGIHIGTTVQHSASSGAVPDTLFGYQTYTEAAQEAIFTDGTNGQGFFTTNGLTRGMYECSIPQGEWNNDTLTALAATGMLSARSSDVQNQLPLGLVANLYNVPLTSNAMTGAISLSTLKTRLDDCMNARVPFTFYAHEFVTSGAGANQWNTADFIAFVDYAVHAYPDVPWITASEYRALQSGPIMVPPIRAGAMR